MADYDDDRVLRMAPGDTVVIARTPLAAGSEVLISGTPVTLTQDAALGFKLAAAALDAGAVVFRNGFPIGRLTDAVGAGALVHTHNLESLYLRTHRRGES